MNTATKPAVVGRPVEAFDDAPRPGRGLDVARRRRRWLIPGGLGLLVVAGLGILWALIPRPVPPNPVAVTPVRPPAVVGLGYLEPASSVIKIGAPGSADALRIGALKVGEGDRVEAGQVLAVLDTIDRLAAQVAASEAILNLKGLMLKKQKVEIASSVTARRSALERAKAELEATTAEFNRQKTLLDRGVTTVANVEKKRRELLTAEATAREMEAAVKRAETLTSISGDKPRSIIDIAVTELELVSAEAELKVVRASLEMATIRAPFSGQILSIKTRAGERIGADGILEMGATDTMRAIVEVYQSDIARVRIGQKVSVRAADVLGEPIAGSVERISPAVKRQSIVNNDPATATDARVVEVFVTFDPDTSRRIASLSRLQVTAVFSP